MPKQLLKNKMEFSCSPTLLIRDMSVLAHAVSIVSLLLQRHKLSKDWFVPSSLKNIEVNGIYGDKVNKTVSFMTIDLECIFHPFLVQSR